MTKRMVVYQRRALFWGEDEENRSSSFKNINEEVGETTWLLGGGGNDSPVIGTSAFVVRIFKSTWCDDMTTVNNTIIQDSWSIWIAAEAIEYKGRRYCQEISGPVWKKETV